MLIRKRGRLLIGKLVSSQWEREVPVVNPGLGMLLADTTVQTELRNGVSGTPRSWGKELREGPACVLNGSWLLNHSAAMLMK